MTKRWRSTRQATSRLVAPVHRPLGARRCEPSRGGVERPPEAPISCLRTQARSHQLRAPAPHRPARVVVRGCVIFNLGLIPLLPNCPRVPLLCGFVISSSFGISLISHSYKSLSERFHHAQYMRMLPQPFCCSAQTFRQILTKLNVSNWKQISKLLPSNIKFRQDVLHHCEMRFCESWVNLIFPLKALG